MLYESTQVPICFTNRRVKHVLSTGGTDCDLNLIPLLLNKAGNKYNLASFTLQISGSR